MVFIGECLFGWPSWWYPASRGPSIFLDYPTYLIGIELFLSVECLFGET